MRKLFLTCGFAAVTFGLAFDLQAQQPTASPTDAKPAAQTQQAQTAQQFEEWKDDFDGDKLDAAKWEKHALEGGGGKIQLKEGELRMRGVNNSRSGIWTTKEFNGDKFLVEASLAKVGGAYPQPGSSVASGFANLTVLFDSAGRYRLEWIMTSEGVLEAWAGQDGRMERVDKRNLGTKMKNPTISVGRRGDEFLYILNSAENKPETAQIALTTTLKNMPKTFRVMLYGYGSSENNWNSVRVVVPK